MTTGSGVEPRIASGGAKPSAQIDSIISRSVWRVPQRCPRKKRNLLDRAWAPPSACWQPSVASGAKERVGWIVPFFFESDETEDEATGERTTRVGRPRGGMKVAARIGEGLRRELGRGRRPRGWGASPLLKISLCGVARRPACRPPIPPLACLFSFFLFTTYSVTQCKSYLTHPLAVPHAAALAIDESSRHTREVQAAPTHALSEVLHI